MKGPTLAKQSSQSITELMRITENKNKAKPTPLVHSMIIPWLLNLCKKIGSSNPTFNGSNIELVKVCGRISKAVIQPTKLVITIDDGFGCIELSINKRYDQSVPDMFQAFPSQMYIK
jgi:hypothetical protein